MSWQQVCFDYDGSYPGFLTCVFESYAHREEAVCFTSPEEDRLTLWPERHVDTDQAKAERVYRSLSKKISPQACRLVTQAFLTCLPERELHMYRFLRLGYQRGADITRDLTDDRVHVLWKAVQHLGSEAHLLKGFLRFSDQQGVLVGEIEPKNRVLPLLRPHFCTRYSEEHFLIYDRTHRELLIHQPGRWAILPAEDFAPAPPGQEEVTYRRLWRRFYDTIAIRGTGKSPVPDDQHAKAVLGHYDGIPARRGRTPRPWTAGEGMVKKAQRLENTPGAAPYLQSFLSGQPRLSRKI